MKLNNSVWERTYLSCSSCHGQVTTIFAQMNLLNAKSRVITIWVKAAHLKWMQYTVERSYVKNKLKNRLYYMITQKSQRKSFDCNLAERWPLALSALVHVVIGVSISVEHGSRAQFVYGVETDPRGIPKTHCSIFMPTHGKKEDSRLQYA